MLEAAAAYAARRPRLRQARRRRHRPRQRARPSRRREGWLARFPMWDWVGGRTSELSAVGLLPAALQGLDIDALLAGAARMRRSHPRRTTPCRTPPPSSPSCGTHAGGGQGKKDMVVLPYKDRLAALLALPAAARDGVPRQGTGPRRQRRPPGHRRLRQQGLHRPARLRAAAPRRASTTSSPPSSRCSATATRRRRPIEVEPDVTSGDYLHGFFQGTRTPSPTTAAKPDHHPRRPSTPAPSARSSPSTSAPSASTPRSSTSTPTTSPA